MSTVPVPGDQVSFQDRMLESGAAMTQNFGPTKDVCAHLCAWHVYANDPKRVVEAHHYCAHLTQDVRQCLIYDSNERGARLIGIEYMITRKLYEGLDESERKLWHSHEFEVKGGLLVMPTPVGVPEAVWELAETKEMEQVVGLYGKTWHLWQVDRGDALPVGQAQLMTSFTNESQIDNQETKERITERDTHCGCDTAHKQDIRAHISSVDIHPDADQVWK